MIYEIQQKEWQKLPESAQLEIFDYFLFIKQRYEIQSQVSKNENETFTLAHFYSNHVEYMSNDDENKIWT